MKEKNTIIWILIALVVLVGGYFIFEGDFNFNNFTDLKDKSTSTKTYVNEDGEEWTVPHGKYEFQVSSADQKGVTFLEGEINPPDVHLGDTQKFRIVVRSDAGIDSVVANIETDNGTTTVPLERTETLDTSELSVPRLKVNENQIVEVLTEDERNQIAESMKEGYLPTAYAQKGENEVWEGEWKVQDVHDTTYITKFVATDNNGESEDLVLAWSDKCGIPLNGNWGYSSSCSHNSGVDGVAGGDANYGGGTLSINGGTFVVEGTFNLNGGEVALGGGELDLESTLWIDDDDNDGYPPSGYSQYTSGGLKGETQTTARYSMSGSWETDCYDNFDYDTNEDGSDTNPGVTSWHSSPNDKGSWDYNCDGYNEKRYNEGNGSCSSCQYSGGKITGECYSAGGTTGFTTYVGCGGSGTLILDSGTACSWDGSSCQYNTGDLCKQQDSATQTCR